MKGALVRVDGLILRDGMTWRRLQRTLATIINPALKLEHRSLGNLAAPTASAGRFWWNEGGGQLSGMWWARYWSLGGIGIGWVGYRNGYMEAASGWNIGMEEYRSYFLILFHNSYIGHSFILTYNIRNKNKCGCEC